MKSLYIIGSLRNPNIADFTNQLSKLGLEAFSEWKSAGESADDSWKEYAIERGWTYKQGLDSHAAQHVFDFDKKHLDRCDGAVLLMPAGKSAHLELGYTIGKGKPAFIVFESEPEDRWDVMYLFATKVFFSYEEFFQHIKETYAN